LWAGKDIPYFDSEEHEVLLYVGCTSSYDRRAQGIARAVAQVLRQSGVAFGVLGENEPCCGESALQVGHRPYFREVSRESSAVLLETGAGKMVVISPHCFDVFRNHYPGLNEKLEVQHYTQFLEELISSDRLRFGHGLRERITFQDPCFLGRKNGEYDAPRRILGAIPGVEQVEMADCRENAVCCGGGGGRMWLETPASERFSDLRIQQAANESATVVATACPFCVSCLEDSIKALRVGGLRVMDLAEIALAALDG
jgi:Fe-S oxidoreductase